MQSKFKCLGDIKDLQFGPGCSITREPWPFFDVKGGGIVFGRNVVISSGVHILTHDHYFDKANWRDLDEKGSDDPTIINDDVFLGINTLVMPSCKSIGKSSVLAAGSVVTKNVPPYEIWGGNPAIRIGTVQHD